MRFYYIFFTLFLGMILSARAQKVFVYEDAYNLYYDRMSYEPGDTLNCYVSSIENKSKYSIYLYDHLGKMVDSAFGIDFVTQHPATNRPFADGFGYKRTFRYVIPSNLKSGIYWFGDKRLGYFIIKNTGRKDKPITILWPTNTLFAYDSAGGRSFYISKDTLARRGDTISFKRPLYNVVMLKFMKWMDLIGNYDYQIITDVDMDDYNEFKNSKMLMVIGHSEYWTKEARQNFDRFVDQGKNVLLLSGNTMWWHVRYTNNKSKIICYKDYNKDPEADTTDRTDNWNDPHSNLPVLSSVGADWNHGGFGDSANIYAAPGFKIINAGSPIFKGTNLQEGDYFIEASREYDGTIYSEDSTGRPIVDSLALGFCQVELIATHAIKQPSSMSKKNPLGSMLAIQKTLTSGKIINTASNYWPQEPWVDTALAQPGQDTVKMSLITKNMIDLLVNDKNIFTNPHCLLTGIEKASLSGPDFQIFPNPASGRLNLQRKGLRPTEKLQVRVYDQLGRMVIEQQSVLPDEKLDISFLSNGVYTLQLTGTERTYTERFVKTN